MQWLTAREVPLIGHAPGAAVMSQTFPEPQLLPENGWTPLTELLQFSAFPSFVSGEPEGHRIRVRYFRRDEDQAVVGKTWFGHMAEGPPGHAHGGSVSALLDEAMGFSAWLAGHTVVAAKLTVNFRRMMPLGLEAGFEAWVNRVSGRKVVTEARLHDVDGNVFAEASGLFLNMEFERLGKSAK